MNMAIIGKILFSYFIMLLLYYTDAKFPGLGLHVKVKLVYEMSVDLHFPFYVQRCYKSYINPTVIEK